MFYSMNAPDKTGSKQIAFAVRVLLMHCMTPHAHVLKDQGL